LTDRWHGVSSHECLPVFEKDGLKKRLHWHERIAGRSTQRGEKPVHFRGDSNSAVSPMVQLCQLSLHLSQQDVVVKAEW
jgi:hypothetical protein